MIETGTTIGNYRIEGLLGRGGMAEVYRAWNLPLGRHEALKVLPLALTQDRHFVERFLHEAHRAARLNHPNVATILAVSDHSAAQPYIAMELIEGEDLADLLARRGTLPLSEALPLLEQIASALDYAHSQGVIHRAVKPANVLLEDGTQIKLVDFGIARASESSEGAPLAQAGMIIGTPEYMSPEQFSGYIHLSPATDLYSLAVIAYEMLCGRPPFGRGVLSAVQVAVAHVQERPVDPQQINPSISKVANAALLRALSKRPDERFASCTEFVRALAVDSVPLVVDSVPLVQGTALSSYATIGLSASQVGANEGVLRRIMRRIRIVFGLRAPSIPRPILLHEIPVPQLSNSLARFQLPALATIAIACLLLGIHMGNVIGPMGVQMAMPTPTSKPFVYPTALATPEKTDVPNTNATPTPVPLATAASNDSDMVFSTVDDWISAWERLNVDDCMNNYARDARIYASGRWYSYDQYYAHIRESFSHGGNIRITRGDARVSVNGDKATVAFPTTFTRKGGIGAFFSRGTQRFEMRKVNGRWLIAEDDFTRSASASK